MKRNIDLDGATNFRDLGGYEASNGSKIKKGLVFRSDHLSNLTIEDINDKATLEYISYRLEKPKFDVEECIAIKRKCN